MLMQELIRAQPIGRADAQRMNVDIHRLEAARYCVLLMGAALLSWLGVQVLFLDGALTAFSALLVASTSVLGPGIVWVVSGEQLNLRRELMERSRLLQLQMGDKIALTLQLEARDQLVEQRRREIRALNALAHSHFAECPLLNLGAGEDATHQQESHDHEDAPEVFILPPLVLGAPGFVERAAGNGAAKSDHSSASDNGNTDTAA